MADDYRQRCADAIFDRLTSGTIVLHSSVTDLVGKKPGDVTEYDLADAVLAVRDQDMETLRAENEDLRTRVDHLDADEVRVRRADLDLVMNGAGDATRMAGWAAACQRIRDALEGEHHG